MRFVHLSLSLCCQPRQSPSASLYPRVAAMLALCFLSLVLCSLVVPLHGYVRYSLDGYDWSVCNVNGSIVVPATVPGVIHLDLLRAGLIDEPYYRFNEEAYRWIVYEPHWTFTKLFTPDPSLLHHAAVELAFDGLDTVAAVFLNGQQLASSNNMFRRLTVPLGAALLLPGQNNLTVRLGSPVLHAQAYYEQYPYELPVSDPAGEVPFRNFLRKAQSDSGWDWGGGFAPSGIWKHVELRAFDEALLVDATFVAKQLRDEQWLVNVTAYLRVAPQPNGALLQATVTTKVAGAAVSATVQLPASDLSDGDDVSVVSVVSTVQSPSLWWPVGYGNATLYPLTVAYHGTRDSDSLSRSVGFRSIRVVREQIPADQPGRSMFFEVNGLPLFAKGSNLVPFDSFHPRVTAANITRMMDSAAASHQNIIRIWGGGIFQDELVYQYADQHGILIWQEFLFACAMYPVDESFLANVREEVSQAVRRLASHASLAIFGGNNENEAMLNWQQVTITNRDRYVVDEAQLYLSTVRDALVREIGNTSIEFQSSSPSNGQHIAHSRHQPPPEPPQAARSTRSACSLCRFSHRSASPVLQAPSPRGHTPFIGGTPTTMTTVTITVGYTLTARLSRVEPRLSLLSCSPSVLLCMCLGRLLSGYNYDADCSDVAVFPRSRFISEFGWQSLPSLFTWRQMSEPSDWSYRSPLSLFRQHHDGGYDQMEAGIRRYFNFPNATDSVQLFNDTIYMTQVHQSYCYSQGINHWRRIKQESPGNTMGQ